MPPNLGGFFMVRSYYPSECHADYFDFERIEALKLAIEACGISTLSQSPMLGFHKQMDNRMNLFQELDAVIHLLMEAKHWGLRKSRNATSLNSRFKSLDTLKVKIISVTFRRVIRTNHKKASKIWRHENIQLGGCQS